MGRSASQAGGDFAPLLTAEVGGGDSTPTKCAATCSDDISRKYAATQRDRKLAGFSEPDRDYRVSA
ncbi:hypothetical protein ACVWXM_002133 [Bradyrhizobium sp. GM7.3]|jgi:hypothetical protein